MKKEWKIINLSIFLLITSLLLASCAQQYSKSELQKNSPLPRNSLNRDAQSIREEKIIDADLKTQDNVSIKGTFYKGKNDMPSVILLHMLDRNKNDWNEFAIALQKSGYNALAIDSRGHGQSGLNWKEFSHDDFNKMVFDVKAAKEFLVKNGVGNEVAIIGASIGANAALNYAAQDNSIKTIILLSPGLDYKGIKTEEAISQFNNPVLIAASEGDSYAADSSRTLNSLSKNSELKIYPGSAHGTALLKSMGIQNFVISWIQENLK